MDSGRWRRTCARVSGPSLAAQPALLASWVRRFLSWFMVVILFPVGGLNPIFFGGKYREPAPDIQDISVVF